MTSLRNRSDSTSKAPTDVESDLAEKAVESDASSIPPDGGFHGWLIVLASFLANGLVFGIHNCYSIIYLRLKNELELSGITDAATKASFMGSLSIGMTFFISPLAGILIDSIGLRLTAILGGAIATVGLLASSFALAHVEALYFTYGVLFGAGASLAYNPSLIILGHYFRRRLGVVNGIVTAGSSVFTIALPYLLDTILNDIGLAATFQVLAGTMALLMICALSYVPVLQIKQGTQECGGSSVDENSPKRCGYHSWNKYINFSIWKNKKYVIWAIAVPFSMLGYFVPYVHLVAYTKDIKPDADGKVLILCLGVTSGVGRLLFGKIGDLPRVNRVVLQQVAFFAYGVCTMLLTVACEVKIESSFPLLVTLCLFMGLFDGCFVSLIGPIAFDLCGSQSASQAIGFLLGLYTPFIVSGPTVAGALYEAFRSYQIPFLLAGCTPIICAFIMLFIHRIRRQEARQQRLAIAAQVEVEQNNNNNNSKEDTDFTTKTGFKFFAAKSNVESHQGNAQPPLQQNIETCFPSSSSTTDSRKGPLSNSTGGWSNNGSYPVHSLFFSEQRSKSNPATLTGFSSTSSAILW